MNEHERFEELASGYVLGTLTESQLGELERALRASQEARRLFAELCQDEMLLWQHWHARPHEAPAPARRRQPLPRGLARLAALVLAGVGGWLLSVRFPARDLLLPTARLATEADERPSELLSRPDVLPILYPPPPASGRVRQVVFPLDFDERGRPVMQPIRRNQTLEITNL